jgi:hypothetical protein
MKTIVIYASLYPSKFLVRYFMSKNSYGPYTCINLHLDDQQLKDLPIHKILTLNYYSAWRLSGHPVFEYLVENTRESKERRIKFHKSFVKYENDNH